MDILFQPCSATWSSNTQFFVHVEPLVIRGAALQFPKNKTGGDATLKAKNPYWGGEGLEKRKSSIAPFCSTWSNCIVSREFGVIV